MTDLTQSPMRAHLARSTAARHEALHHHRWISRLAREDLTLADYRCILSAYACILACVDQAARAIGVPEALGVGPSLAALRRDVADLGGPPLNMGPKLPLELRGQSAVLGALYVLHGSGFGAAMLRRNLARCLPDAPCSYLALGTPSPLWRAYLARLAEVDPNGTEGRAMTTAACDVFECFDRYVADYCDAASPVLSLVSSSATVSTTVTKLRSDASAKPLAMM